MSIFSIGLSGLNAARSAFNTTSNNISNVNTPGYNRERTLLSERPGMQGVKVDDTQRQFDRYVAQQRNSADSRSSALDAYQTQVTQIDNLLADQDAGLQPLMQKFFSAVSELSASPSDPAARQGVIGSADTMAAQFRSFDQYLSDMGSGLDGQLRDQVGQINDYTGQIAKLNKQIVLARAKQGKAPNSLLDQRDQLIHDLGKRANVQVSVQDGGSYNISVGNGQPLVAGNKQFKLTTMQSHVDPTHTAVGYRDSAGNTVELKDSTFQGGTLGGLLEFRDQSLDPARNRIGQLAASFAQAFNKANEAGVDLHGDPGQALFKVGSPSMYADTDNAGSATLSADFDPANVDQLTSSDYNLRYDAANGDFRVTRLDTGETTTATLDANHQLSVGGVTVTVDDPAQLADGDRFQLQPTRNAASGFDNLIHDTDKIAAAGPAGGSGNNENALAMEALQNADTVGGKASFSDAYASLVDQVGSQTNTVKVNLKASQGLSDQLEAVQQSQSGVNLDEESVNLVRYQQFYQANAKVIQTGSNVLDAILRLN